MSDEENDNQEKAVVRKKKKSSASKYSYSFGDIYPGVRLGHRDCNPFANLPWLIPGGPYGVILGTSHGNARGDANGRQGAPMYASGYRSGGSGYGGGAGGYGGTGFSVYGGTASGFEGGHGPPGGYSGAGANLPGYIPGVPPGGILQSSRGGINGANLVPPRRLGQVPPHMGWLWNAPDSTGKKHPRGWQPGALGKSVAKVMTFKISRSGGRDPKKDKKKKNKRKRRQGGDKSAGEAEESEPEEELEPKPALKVQRKGDVFTIQVNPLKDLTEIGPLEDPYVDCDPMVFKIIKKRSPEEQAKVEARKLIKLKRQRDAEIRRALAEAAEDICKCAYMDVFCNDLTAIDKVIEKCPAFKEPECLCQDESLSSLSSNASWDIEYTPPFGCFDLSPRKAKNYIHTETQYCPVDAGIKPVEWPNGYKQPKRSSINSLKFSKCKKRVSKGCTCCNDSK